MKAKDIWVEIKCPKHGTILGSVRYSSTAVARCKVCRKFYRTDGTPDPRR